MSAATLRRWGEQGIIPDYRGRWTRAAAAHARIVARLREQGHSLDEIKEAGEDGRLAFGYVEELFPAARAPLRRSRRRRSETGLEEALIERLWRSMGFPSWMLDHLGEEDLEALRYMAAVLEAGFPLVAFLQVLHVYGQALRQIADAEARLFRIYVHEPLIKGGVPSTQMSEEMGELIARAAAADDSADGLPAPQLPAALGGAGRDREHVVRPARRRARGARPAPRRDRVRGPRRLRALHRGGGRAGGARPGRELRRARWRSRCPAARAWSRTSATA